ncbi:MAG: hypothetical protein N2645_18005 [Clostridia bacterium]|nr:hypothetical protein [Clostridia bacterium]
MCTQCVYKEANKKRTEIMYKAAHYFGYYKMALKAANERNDQESADRYVLIVKILEEIVAAGKLSLPESNFE